jgi:hypothetical protein
MLVAAQTAAAVVLSARWQAYLPIEESGWLAATRPILKMSSSDIQKHCDYDDFYAENCCSRPLLGVASGQRDPAPAVSGVLPAART